ncbi:pilin [Saccharothrix sp. MB29]|nr:pilin [Saccharothrix sp. MB29]
MRLTRTPVRPRNHRRPVHRAPARGLAPHRTGTSSHDGPAPRSARDARTCAAAGLPTRAAVRGRTHRRVLVLAELVVLALFASGSSAHAETVVLAIAGSVDEVLSNIRNWLMGILAGLATVFLTVGGVRRVFGGGDPGEQEKAKEAFKAAGMGYALAALAPLVVTVLKGIVGA